MPRLQNGELVRITARVPWIAHFNAVTNEWLGVCHPLNLNAAGETFAEMQAVANEAMQLLFEDLLASSELDAFLTRNGWRAERRPAVGSRVRFDVPSEWQQGSIEQALGV